MIVAKLGGSLLSDVAAMRDAIAQLRSQPTIGIVVVSALQGQTRQLLQLAQTPSSTAAMQLIHAWQSHFTQAQVATNTDIVQTAFTLIEQAGQQSSALSPQSQDELLAQGELLTSWLIYQLCLQQGMATYWQDIRPCLRTTAHYGAAQPRRCRLVPQADGCMITQGYIGADQQGHTTTLGFEGSDYAASLIAAAVQANALWVYKDVGALYSANPHWLEQAQAYPYVSYQQAIALAQAGASILHPQAVQPAQQAQIPIYITALNQQQQTRISQQAYPDWFAMINPAVGRLTILGDYSMLDLQPAEVIQQTPQQISLSLPPVQLDQLACQWHQQLLEAHTCLLL